jgi:hypothetical protein
MLFAGSGQVLVIGFSADIGRRLGDTKEDCRSAWPFISFCNNLFFPVFWKQETEPGHLFGMLQHVHRVPLGRRRRVHFRLLVPRLRQQHRPGTST